MDCYECGKEKGACDSLFQYAAVRCCDRCRHEGPQQMNLNEMRPDPAENTVGKMHADAQPTEKAAAYAVYPRSGTQRRRILEYIRAVGGALDEDISADTGIIRQSELPRRFELVEGGWVKDSGRRKRTMNGSMGIVWEATDKLPTALEFDDDMTHDRRGAGEPPRVGGPL